MLKKVFDLETGDVSWESIQEILIGARVVGLEYPESQDLECTWYLILKLDNGKLLRIFSEHKGVAERDEVGAIRLDMDVASFESNPKFKSSSVSPFTISKIGVIRHSSDDADVSCGIVFVDSDGLEIVVAAAVPPGAVSVKAPFFSGPFSPLISLDTCIYDWQ